MVKRKILKINEDLCDGCGICIPKCIEGAIKLVDGKVKIIKDSYCDGLGACLGHCPKKALSIIGREAPEFNKEEVYSYLKEKNNQKEKIGRTQWPVQLNLVPEEAPYFNDANLLLIADCVPFAYPNFHKTLALGRNIVVGCPKFDDARAYEFKLGNILGKNNVKSLLIAHMEVPCCSGLKLIAEKAVESSNKKIPIEYSVIGIDGVIK